MLFTPHSIPINGMGKDFGSWRYTERLNFNTIKLELLNEKYWPRFLFVDVILHAPRSVCHGRQGGYVTPL